jgi:hypothetical protein
MDQIRSTKHEFRNKPKIQKINFQNVYISDFGQFKLFRISNFDIRILDLLLRIIKKEIL